MGGQRQSIPELLTGGPDLIGGNRMPCRDTSEIAVIENNVVPLGRGLN